MPAAGVAGVLADCAPVRLADGVTLLPAPLTARDPGRDTTAWMDAAESPEGDVRIGLGHGLFKPLNGFPQSLSKLRNFPRAENNQHDDQYKE